MLSCLFRDWSLLFIHRTDTVQEFIVHTHHKAVGQCDSTRAWRNDSRCEKVAQSPWPFFLSLPLKGHGVVVVFMRYMYIIWESDWSHPESAYVHSMASSHHSLDLVLVNTGKTRDKMLIIIDSPQNSLYFTIDRLKPLKRNVFYPTGEAPLACAFCRDKERLWPGGIWQLCFSPDPSSSSSSCWRL